MVFLFVFMLSFMMFLVLIIYNNNSFIINMIIKFEKYCK